MQVKRKGPLEPEELMSLEDPEEITNEMTLLWILGGQPQEQFAVASFFFKCERCGNCCTSFDNIAISQREVSRLAKHLGVSEEDFRSRYTRGFKLPSRGLSKPGLLSLNVPCPFYLEGGCSVYSIRPGACVLFPCFMSLQSTDQVIRAVTVDPSCRAFRKALDYVLSHEKESYEKEGRFLDGFANRP
jgi:Fe-S-cluster containining protein